MNGKTKKVSSRAAGKKAGGGKLMQHGKGPSSSAPDGQVEGDERNKIAAISHSPDIRRERDMTPLAAFSLPLASKAVFWPPRHGQVSKDIVHTPLLFWLVETVRPARVVQLGLRDPGSYLAVCQAMDRLGLEGQVWAVASAGEADDLGAARQEQHDEMYGDFSSILTYSCERALQHLRGVSIDLMVLDMPSEQLNIASVCNLWFPLLSDRGVIILKGSDVDDQDEAGSSSILSNLSESYPTFRSRHGEQTFQVILHGANQPERLRHLTALDLGMPGYLAVRQVFRRLGQGLVDGQAQQRDRVERREMRCEMEALNASIAEIQESLDNARKEASESKDFAQQLQERYNERQASLFDLEVKLEAANQSNSDLQKKLAQALERRQAIWQAHELLKAELRALKGRAEQTACSGQDEN